MEKSPQLENGFIQIATGSEENDIFSALIKAGLNSTEYQIVLLVIRKTYGFKKKEDLISISQFEKYINKTRVSIINSISSLVKKNILVKETTLGKMSSYSFNKKFETWNRLVKKSVLVKKVVQTSKENFTRLVKKTIPTKDIYTKETITKDTLATKVANLNIYIDMFKGVNPNHERLFGNKTQRDCLERMIIKFGAEKMTNLLTQLPSILSKPYAPQISTPTELETKMGKLIQFYNQEQLKIAKNGSTKI